MGSDTKIFGFWVYLMTDLIIFAILFTSFFVLRDGSTTSYLDLPSTFAKTLILLTSSFTCALAVLMVHQKRRTPAIVWFITTFILGATFLTLEWMEFASLLARGATWQHSASWSSFFTLVGTHGLHIAVGLLWLLVTILRLILRPLVYTNIVKTTLFVLFWHFLDIVWIFIFTVVYGMEHLL